MQPGHPCTALSCWDSTNTSLLAGILLWASHRSSPLTTFFLCLIIRIVLRLCMVYYLTCLACATGDGFLSCLSPPQINIY